MKERTLLIDADVLRYQIAFSNEDTVEWEDDGEVDYRLNPAKAALDTENFLKEITEKLKGTDVVIVLSGKRNFRVELDETYKANRKKPKPQLWHVVSDYLEWGDHGHKVIEMDRLEGDDVLGILHTGEYKDRSVIVTIDKDMLTVPGYVYRWNRPEEGVVHVTPEDAAWFHLTQVLTGDTVDNYKGLPGAGPAKAAALIEECTDPLEFWASIVAAYEQKGYTEADAIHQARLAFILHDGYYNPETHKVKLWDPSHLQRLLDRALT